MQKKRIADQIMPIDYLMITPNYPPNIGGVEKHVYEVHRALKTKHIRGLIVVNAVCPAQMYNLNDIAWLNPRRLWGWVPWTAKILSAFKFLKILEKTKPRIIHFHDSTIYFLEFVLLLFGLLPRTFITFHGWEGVFPPDLGMVKKRVRIDAKVKSSMAIGSFIAKWYGTKSKVVSYGGAKLDEVDNYSILKENSSIVKIAYFGRLELDTGIDLAVQSIIKFNEMFGDRVTFDIYGDGSMRNNIVALSHKNQYGSIRIFTPTTEIVSMLRKYDVIIASGYLTIIEALQAERVVIAFYDNNLREDYLRMHPVARSIFICQKSAEFSQVIQRCVSDWDAVREYSRYGWEWAKKQTWEEVANSYVKLWHE